MDIQQIIEGCKRENRASQKALYDGYFGSFMAICLRYLPVRADAEEALNNAFLRIYRHISQYKGEGSFEGWMKKVVVNSCLAFVRTAAYENRTKIISLSQSLSPEEPGREVADGNGIDEKYSRDYLYSLLANLPEMPRLVFNMYVFENYNHNEIAETLNIAERTSQAHLAKARTLLASELDKNKLIQKIQRV